MNDLKKKDICIVGSGVAGAAIAQTLCEEGHTVTLLYRNPSEGASYTNQKWQHSGLLYPSRGLAKRAWGEYQECPQILQDYEYKTGSKARFLTLQPATFQLRKKWWDRDWNVKEWGLPWRELENSEYVEIGTVGRTMAVGGFETPDRIVDFPAVIDHLRNDIVNKGGQVLEGAKVRRVLVKSSISEVSGIEYDYESEPSSIDCDICILAAGAWTDDILTHSKISLNPEIIRKKCIVLAFGNELVPSITTCLDIQKRDGSTADVTLVPFKGKTLAAGNSWEECVDPDAALVSDKEVEDLMYELCQCFPKVRDLPYTPHVCIKTEQRVATGRPPTLSPKVYRSENHGVDGLLVALPGKASFLYDVAQAIQNEC